MNKQLQVYTAISLILLLEKQLSYYNIINNIMSYAFPEDTATHLIS